MKKIIGVIYLVIGLVTLADSYTPSYSCSKPYKPYEFNDEWEIKQFESEVEDYRRCIEDFIEEEKEDIKRHQNAIEEATDEWNGYIRYEL